MRFFGVFLGCKANARRSVHSPQDHFIIILILVTNVTDATLGASALWLGTRTRNGGTDTLESFFGRSPWLHGQQVIQNTLGEQYKLRIYHGIASSSCHSNYPESEYSA